VPSLQLLHNERTLDNETKICRRSACHEIPPLLPTDERQISNVGFYDVSESEVKGAVTADTLFIHGSDSRGGSKLNKGESTSADGIDVTIATRSANLMLSNSRMYQNGISNAIQSYVGQWVDHF